MTLHDGTTHLELPGMHAIVALHKWVAEVVYRVALEASEGAIVEVEVVWVPKVVAGAVLQVPCELGDDRRRLQFTLLLRLVVVRLVRMVYAARVKQSGTVTCCLYASGTNAT